MDVGACERECVIFGINANAVSLLWFSKSICMNIEKCVGRFWKSE